MPVHGVRISGSVSLISTLVKWEPKLSSRRNYQQFYRFLFISFCFVCALSATASFVVIDIAGAGTRYFFFASSFLFVLKVLCVRLFGLFLRLRMCCINVYSFDLVRGRFPRSCVLFSCTLMPSVRPTAWPSIPLRLHYRMCIGALVLFTRVIYVHVFSWELLGAAPSSLFDLSPCCCYMVSHSVWLLSESAPSLFARTHSQSRIIRLSFILLSLRIRSMIFFSLFFSRFALYSQNPRIIYLW